MNTQQEFSVSFSVSIVYREGSVEGAVVADCLRWLELHQEKVSPRAETYWNCFINCFVEKFDGYFQIKAWEKVVISRRHRDLHTSMQLLESELAGKAIAEVRLLLSLKLEALYEKMLKRVELKIGECDWNEARRMMKVLMRDLAESDDFYISEETRHLLEGLTGSTISKK